MGSRGRNEVNLFKASMVEWFRQSSAKALRAVQFRLLAQQHSYNTLTAQ